MNKRQVDDMKSMKEYCNSVEDCGLCIMKKLCETIKTYPGEWEIPKPHEEGEEE